MEEPRRMMRSRHPTIPYIRGCLSAFAPLPRLGGLPRSFAATCRPHRSITMIPMTPDAWLSRGPLFALAGVLLAIAALGWDPALRALTLDAPAPSQFRFHPHLMPAWLLLILLLGSGSLILLLAALSARGWLL